MTGQGLLKVLNDLGLNELVRNVKEDLAKVQNTETKINGTVLAVC